MHWSVRFSPRERGQLEGYSGNELTLTQESVRRVEIWKKCLPSYEEMTSGLHRAPRATGRAKKKEEHG